MYTTNGKLMWKDNNNNNNNNNNNSNNDNDNEKTWNNILSTGWKYTKKISFKVASLRSMAYVSLWERCMGSQFWHHRELFCSLVKFILLYTKMTAVAVKEHLIKVGHFLKYCEE